MPDYAFSEAMTTAVPWANPSINSEDQFGGVISHAYRGIGPQLNGVPDHQLRGFNSDVLGPFGVLRKYLVAITIKIGIWCKAMTRLLTAIAIAALGGILLANQGDKVRKELEKAGDSMMTAMKKKDLDTLKNIVTSDFKATSKGQSFDRAKWISLSTQMLSMTKFSSISHVIHSVKSSGNQAVLKTTTMVNGSITLPGKKSQVLTDVSVDEETWVKKGGVWKLKLDKTVTETTKLDGKVFSGGV